MAVDALSWLIGLIEGEGSFHTIKPHVKSRQYPCPVIAIRMTDRQPIERAATILGTKVYALKPLPSGKHLYALAIRASQAAGWMMTLYADMSPRRREQITRCLANWKRRLWVGPNLASWPNTDRFYKYDHYVHRLRDEFGRWA